MPSTMQGQHRKNKGQQRIGLVIFLVFHPGPLSDRIDFFYWGSRGGRPRGLSNGNRRSDGDAFLHDLHRPLPDAGEGLVLLAPHLRVHPLIEFGHHPFSKTLVKTKNKKQNKKQNKQKTKKERKKQKGATLTNSFSLRFRCSVGQKKKVLDLGNGRLESAGQPNR